MLVIKQLTVAVDFYNTMKVNGCRQLKETHTGLEQLKWQIYLFLGWTIPLKQLFSSFLWSPDLKTFLHTLFSQLFLGTFIFFENSKVCLVQWDV